MSEIEEKIKNLEKEEREELEKELAELFQKVYETMKKEREKAFVKFKQNYEKYKEEIKEWVYSDISRFIDLACRERGIQFELQHRLIPDFVWFIDKAREEIDDAWLWSFREAFFYFYKFYEIMFSDRNGK